jgi:phenylalanyl-tRNA synthetase beta chain
MKILISWLQDHIVETLPSDEKIVEALTLKSSEVEGVEKVGDDTVFDIKVLPDRAHYMLSHRGAAYDLCAVLNLTLKDQVIETPVKGDDIKVTIQSDICIRNTSTLITGIQNGASPEWLKNRLEALGARSISAIVDATNYAMLDTGQPLHAFDKDKVVGDVTIRFAKEGETIETLDKKNITLKPTHLVIADESGPLDIAGIKGGKRAEVTFETKNIILEAANFNSVSVRKTSFDIGIRNDASKRFENEITPYLIEKGVSSFLNVLKKISPDAKIGLMSDKYKELPKPWTVNVTHEHIEAILNYKISESRVKEILEKLGCKVSGKYEVTPPFERLDLIIPEDIIDEVGRIEGLDKVKSIVPNVKTTQEFSQEFLLIEKIKDFFYSKGFSEVQTRSLTNKGDIEVAYPMASDKGFLRTSLIQNVSESFKLAEKNAPLLGLEKIQLFEIGKTFPKTGEQLDLCFGICYAKKIKNKDQVIKTELDALAKELEDVLGVKLNAENGYVKNLEKLQTKLTPESIKSEKGSRTPFVQFSKEPFIVRDIALFVESSVNADDVQKIIKESASASAKKLFVKGPDLFDQFEKEGKKSLAFRMIFQADDRTLTDEETNGFMDKVYSAVKAKGWEVR